MRRIRWRWPAGYCHSADDEAITACVTPLGIICFVILMCLVFGGHSALYEWVDKSAVAKDRR